MVGSALMLLTASALGFGLGWLLRSLRLQAMEAAASAQAQGLQLKLEQACRELRELSAAHNELRHQHFDESTARASAEAIASQLPALVGKLEEREREITTHRERIATLEVELTAERASLEKERALLEQTRVTFENSFEALSAKALRSNNQAFLDLARSTLETFQQGARADLAAR